MSFNVKVISTLNDKNPTLFSKFLRSVCYANFTEKNILVVFIFTTFKFLSSDLSNLPFTTNSDVQRQCSKIQLGSHLQVRTLIHNYTRRGFKTSQMDGEVPTTKVWVPNCYFS